jgi:catechol 2,3-dioxygenase-like lactoylglutathione lyase family enzyme
MAGRADDLIGYVTLGTGDLARSLVFYDKVLAQLGGKRVARGSRDGVQFYGNDHGPMLGLYRPYNKLPPTYGNGTMVAFRARTKAEVDGVFVAACAAGAFHEGAPGTRDPEGTFYGAYFRDPDGNKLCVYCNPQKETAA